MSREIVYRWPPCTLVQERELAAAYSALTGRRVWRSVLLPIVLAYRLHGPDTIPLLRELYVDNGVQDLLRRLIAHPPRWAAHPDYADAPPTLGESMTGSPPVTYGTDVVRCSDFLGHQPLYRQSGNRLVCDTCDFADALREIDAALG